MLLDNTKKKNQNLTGKIINILLNILIFILGFVLLISIYTLIQTKALGNKYSNFFGYSIFEVQSNSMAEEIYAGDWILVKLTKNIKLKDVITYEYKGEFITHRVVEIHKGTIVTRGDANRDKDDPIDESQVVGKVNTILKNFGVFRKTLFNPAVLITLIITLFLLNIVFTKNDEAKQDALTKKILSLFNRNKELKKPVKAVEKVKPIEKTITKEEESIKKDIIEDYNNKTEEFKSLEKDINSEEELEKTIFFRIIPVTDDEIDDNYVPLEEKKSQPIIEENKVTQAYNIIPVDMDELEEKPEIIEVKEDIEQERPVEAKLNQEKEEESVEEASGLTRIEFNLLKNAHKKNKNIIDTVMNLKIDEINKFISIINKGNKTETNESTIKSRFISTYINARYYNIYLNRNIAKELKDNYYGSDKRFNEKVDNYTNIFALYVKIDSAKEISNSKKKKSTYKELIIKYCKDWSETKAEMASSKLMNMQKEYSRVIKYFLKSLDSKTFELELDRLSTRKNIYAVELIHNLSFNKSYSDYIINKTYTEGIVAEDKIMVLMSLLQKELVQNMLEATFNKKYIMHIPDSLFDKESKCEGLLRKIDDEYAKSHIMILVTQDVLRDNSEFIAKLKKSGYKFSLAISDSSKINEMPKKYISLVDNIFLDKRDDNEILLSYIPDELKEAIIYEDIAEKFNIKGGE